MVFALVSFAVVTGMGASGVIDRTLELSAGLEDPAAVLFALAAEYVGPWMATVMSVLVLTSLFAGLLAFQNAAGRYWFALGRGGVLPSSLGTVNKPGAPMRASILTSVIAAIVIVIFAIVGFDGIGHMFFWFSGLAVLAIVLMEILVCIAVIVYFRRNKGEENVFQTIIAPVLALIGLIVGEYLLMSRFGLLAGTVLPGVDPSVEAWGLDALGWVLVLLPFALLVIGFIVAKVRKNVNEDLLKDIVS